MESGCAERRALWGSGWKNSLLEDIQGMSERKMISKQLVSLFFLSLLWCVPWKACDFTQLPALDSANGD